MKISNELILSVPNELVEILEILGIDISELTEKQVKNIEEILESIADRGAIYF
jgi:hypothetical protein